MATTTTTTHCIYRPRAPQPTMNPIPPAVGSVQGVSGAGAVCPPGQQYQVRKNCGFPWWVVWLLIAIIVIGLVWAWFRNRDVPIPVGPANGSEAQNVVTTQTGNVGQQLQQQLQQPFVAAGAVAARPAVNVVGNQNGQKVVKQGSSQTIRDYASLRKPALVMFSMTGCTYCKPTLAELQKAAPYLNIDVFEVNRDHLDAQDYPLGYPYIFLLHPDGVHRTPYVGKRSACNLIEFVRSHLGNNAVNADYVNQIRDCN